MSLIFNIIFVNNRGMIARMNWKKNLKTLFLLGVALLASGFRFRCWFLCSDQTSTQHQYVEARDRCRDYASLKLDMAMRQEKVARDDGSGRKALLVALFSECMGREGWTVPDGREGKSHAAADALAERTLSQAPEAPLDAAAAAETAARRAGVARAAECQFARQSATVSGKAAARARACDLECAQRLKAAPDAPRPAACPSGLAPELATGRDKEE